MANSGSEKINEVPSDGFNDAARPICGFCNAPWSDEMVKILDVSSSGGCETCGYGASVSATIDITCHNCERVIYRKHYWD